MQRPLPVIVQGLGAIGHTILAAVAGDAAFAIVGAVEIDKRLFGRALAEVVPGAPADVYIRPSLGQARADAGLDEAVVLHATGSYLADVAAQFADALRLGLHVVSTCEELSYPFVRHPETARQLDEAARAAGRTLVGTGINPGFLMDALPLTLTAASHSIRSVRVTRVQNPALRREQFQRKVGMGLERATYDRLAALGTFGHVGFEESGRLLAAGLGWEVDAWEADLAAVQPDPAGPVLGTRQTLRGVTADGRRVDLRFEAQSGVTEAYDEIVIEGVPPLRMRFEGGVAGDDATAASVLRCARVIPAAPRGLVTVLDLPLRAPVPD